VGPESFFFFFFLPNRGSGNAAFPFGHAASVAILPTVALPLALSVWFFLVRAFYLRAPLFLFYPPPKPPKKTTRRLKIGIPRGNNVRGLLEKVITCRAEAKPGLSEFFLFFSYFGPLSITLSAARSRPPGPREKSDVRELMGVAPLRDLAKKPMWFAKSNRGRGQLAAFWRTL